MQQLSEYWSVRLMRVADLAREMGGKPIFDVPNSLRVVFDSAHQDKIGPFAYAAAKKFNVRIDTRGPSALVFESRASQLIDRICEGRRNG